MYSPVGEEIIYCFPLGQGLMFLYVAGSWGQKWGPRSLPKLKLEGWCDGCHRVQTHAIFASQSETYKLVVTPRIAVPAGGAEFKLKPNHHRTAQVLALCGGSCVCVPN